MENSTELCSARVSKWESDLRYIRVGFLLLCSLAVFQCFFSNEVLGEAFSKPYKIRAPLQVHNEGPIIAAYLYPARYGFSAIGDSLAPFQRGYFANLRTTDFTATKITVTRVETISPGLMEISCIMPLRYGFSSIGDLAYPFQGGYFDNLQANSLDADALSVTALIAATAKVSRANLFEINCVIPLRYGFSSIGDLANPFQRGYFDYIQADKVVADTVTTVKLVTSASYSKSENEGGISRTWINYGGHTEAGGDTIGVQFLKKRQRGISSTTNLSSKKGGLIFRSDDNYPAATILKWMSVFDQYDYPCSWAFNARRNNTVLPGGEAYLDVVRLFQMQGHELVDHTPSHSTESYDVDPLQMRVTLATAGVDTIIDRGSYYSVYVDYTTDTTGTVGSGTITTVGPDSIFSSENGGFSSGLVGYRIWITAGADSGLYRVSSLFNSNDGDVDTVIVGTRYQESVNFSGVAAQPYYFYRPDHYGEITPEVTTIDGMRLIFQASKRRWEEMGLDPPRMFIQTGSTEAIPSALILRDAGYAEGYLAAAEYSVDGYATSKKVFNEPNADGVRPFAMQWGDFRVDVYDAASQITTIADGIAKHKLMISATHFGADASDIPTWLAKVDSVLMWAHKNGIPVGTHVEWADRLYRQSTNPFENIIPNISVDLDGNLRPDGWTFTGATWDTTDGVAESNSCCIKVTNSNTAKIDDLGGVEKGLNRFTIWTKTVSTPCTTVVVIAPDVGSSYSLEFPAGASWGRYCDDDDVDGNVEDIVIEQDATYIDVTVDSKSANELKVSGLAFRKLQ